MHVREKRKERKPSEDQSEVSGRGKRCLLTMSDRGAFRDWQPINGIKELKNILWKMQSAKEKNQKILSSFQERDKKFPHSHILLEMVAHFNPSTWEAEAGGSLGAGSQARQQRKTCLKKQKINK